jgi:monoamine oxidase
VVNPDVDVVIVGGGAAGIGAARQLANFELSTLLLEAGSALGGRAHTLRTEGVSLDLGCGWLHSAERNGWARIAEESGVTLDRARAQWGVQYRDLGFPKADQEAAHKAFDDWLQRLARTPPVGDCAARALELEGEWNDYIRTIVGFISGAPLERLSIADYRAYDDASSDNNWRVPSGYGALIAASLPATTPSRLSTPATSITIAPQGVLVGTGAGTIRARAVILTVSTAVLTGDELSLPAELDAWREAAGHLPLGRNEKLFLGIAGDAPFEDETQVLGNPRDARSASYYLRPMGMPVIECFFGGDSAEHVLGGGHAAGFDFALEQISALFGAQVRHNLRPLTGSCWTGSRHIGGAYSYALPGHSTARLTLAQSFDERVFFAGEATSARDFSTAHGAYDSGVRAANEAGAALAQRPLCFDAAPPLPQRL